MKRLLLALVLPLCITHGFAQIASLEATFRLETLSEIAVPYQNGMPVPSFEKQRRAGLSLAGQWRKNRFVADHALSLLRRDSTCLQQLLTEAAGVQSPSFNDAAWQLLGVPGVENKLTTGEKAPEFYQNGVWYRTKFSVPDSFQQKFVKLNFDAVNYIADVWLNGKYLGWHEGGFTPFAFDVSSALRYDSANVLVVRVDNIPWGSRKDIVPFYECDWFNYTGIIHDVYLECSNKLSVVRADVVTQNISGLVQTTVVLKNTDHTNANVDVTLRVYAAKNDSLSLTKEVSADLIGAEVALQGGTTKAVAIPADSASVWQTALTIPNPSLWSPQKPALYILKVTLSQNGIVKDEFSTQFGVRTIRTVGDKIYLNEKPVFLHGVARHEDHPVYGRSIPTNIILSDLKMVKGVNANYLRTGHYPNHPYTYLAADRLGLLIMEEIPVWWFDDLQAWSYQNIVRRIHIQMFREMVFRDRNRPSIALWSTSNECKDVGGRVTYLQMLKNEWKAQYPDGRLITQSAAADRPGPYDESQAECDVAGWTMYFGIFYNPYSFGINRGTKYFLVDAHDYFPKTPIIATEYGYWSGEDMSQFDKQVQIFDSTFLAFESRVPAYPEGGLNPGGYLAGVTWWCIFDWYTHQQNPGYQSMGLYRMDRTVAKPVMTSLKNKYKNYVNKDEYLTEVKRAETRRVPTEFSLLQNYPNPFNPTTTIGFRIAVRQFVTLKIFDVLGKEVATLVNEPLEPGSYTAVFGTAAVSSGIYYYTLQAGAFTDTKRMVVVK